MWEGLGSESGSATASERKKGEMEVFAWSGVREGDVEMVVLGSVPAAKTDLPSAGGNR
jgi:hypothetical protein